MVKVDEEKCIGCGSCEAICPEGFEIVDGKSKAKDKMAQCIEKAANTCPTKAISI